MTSALDPHGFCRRLRSLPCFKACMVLHWGLEPCSLEDFDAILSLQLCQLDC